MRQMDNLDQIAPNYATSYFMIHSIDNCEMLSIIIGCNTQINVTFKFTKKLPFEENWRFGPNLTQDYATLYLTI